MDLIRENTPSTSEAKNLNTPANTADPKTPPWPASPPPPVSATRTARIRGNTRWLCRTPQFTKSMNEQTYIAAIIFLLAILIYLLLKIRTHRNEVLKIKEDANKEMVRLKDEYVQIKLEAKQRLDSEIARAKNEGLIIGSAGNYPDFSLQITPYFSHESDSGFFSSKVKTKTGVKYQLFMNGLIVGGPFLDIRDERIEKKVNEENMQRLIVAGSNLALHMAKTAFEESRKSCPQSRLVIDEKEKPTHLVNN